MKRFALHRFAAPALALLATALLAGSGALERLDWSWYDWLQRRLSPK